MARPFDGAALPDHAAPIEDGRAASQAGAAK
jgi:hypothetical protein